MTDAPRSLTLEAIGKLAGVSRSTVSRVLNDHPDVRPEVRVRVEAVIEKTGYLPNQAARALVSNRSGLIGLVMPTEVDELFGDPYYSALVHGIQEGCVETGSLFSIFPFYSPRGQGVLLPMLVAQGVPRRCDRYGRPAQRRVDRNLARPRQECRRRGPPGRS